MTCKFKDSNGLLPDEFLDTFGREFCKYEVLWKPNPNSNEFELQIATHKAYRKLAQALNVTVEAVLELLETFPSACLDLMNRYEMCSRMDAGCSVPDWLKPLARHFRFLDHSMECNKSEVVARHDLMRALYQSAWVGFGVEVGLAGDPMGSVGVTVGGPTGVTVGGPTGVRVGGLTGVTKNDTEDESSPLRGPRAVAYFVARHRVREEEILPVWRSVLHLCVVKLCAVLVAGDRTFLVPVALRPAAAERALADLLLLQDHRVSQINILTPAKLRTLVLLFQLIVAAKETYDREERRTKGYENISSRHDCVERCEARADDSANVASHMIGVPVEPTEAKHSDRGTGTKCASDRLNSTLAESLRYAGPCSTEILLQERLFECGPKRDRREADNVSAETEEKYLDNELHTELDLEPDIQVISIDKSDYDISNKYYKNNIEAPSVLAEDGTKGSGNKIKNKSDVRSSEEREYDISEKSQNSGTESEHPTRYWYKESKSNISEEQRVVWALVYTDFIKRGRSASLISLQHRWVELLHRARVALLTAWCSDTLSDRNVHPLLLVVGHRFPGIVTESLDPWKKLVLERQIVLESDIKHIVNKYLEDDKVLLNITENLTYPDLLKEYILNTCVNDPHCQSESNAPCTIHKENTCNTIESVDKLSEQKIQAQYSSVNNELDVNNTISTVLDQIDPSKATVSIIFDEDSDENVEDESTMNEREAASDLNGERGATSLTEEDNQITEQNTEITMKTIVNEMEHKLNYTKSPVKPRSDLYVRNNNTEFNENITDRNVPLKDKPTVSRDCRSRDDLSSLQPCKPVVDAKLVNISRVVVTPIEHLPEWIKHSRNGVIKCRNFSVKNFTKLVTPDSNRLSKCIPYIDSNKKKSQNYIKNEVRIKFEDDNSETDFGFGDSDINDGIVYQKYIELYGMPDHSRRNRIRLTKKLKLSRTYFSSNFWSLDTNIDLMKLCKPMTIKLSKGLPRVAKRVELSDINEVRKMNRSILTAQVSPTVDPTPPPQAGRSGASHEAINTTRRTNNSISSALDSSQLLKLLTNYAIRTKISESVTEPVTKDITSNLMDSIIDTMRLENQNNIQNSTITPTFNSLQRSPDPPEMLIDSGHTNNDKNISATDTFAHTHTIQKSTEELRNNHKLSPNNNCLAVATTSQIHISSNYAKKLYVKHLQKMNSISTTSISPEETKMPNVRELKDMILILVKHFDNKMRHEYNMKLNRSSLNLHFRNFEKQQRSLVKNISKLTKILPQYVLNMESKGRVTINETAAKKRNQINRNKCKQSKKRSKLPGGNTDDIIDIDAHTGSVLDDDCEPNLIIDETSPELSDNFDLNNSQIHKINSSKSIQETRNIRKKDKKEKKIKRARKRSKQSKKIPAEEKPMLNEYQEWQRQKTMALKYFTIPMTNSGKLTPKDIVAQQRSTSTSTEQQSNGCQTNISMKRKNAEELATTSTSSDLTKRSKSLPHESNVVYISDASSDDDVVITGCYAAREPATGDTSTNKDDANTTRPDIHQIDETEDRNESVLLDGTSPKHPASRNVTSAPAAAATQPVYLIVNDAQQPAGSREAPTATRDVETTNNPLVYRVFSNATPFPTLKRIVPQNITRQIALSCQRTFNTRCKCIKCQTTPRPDDVSAVNSIQNVSSQDAGNNEPSTSLQKKNECPVKEVITVMEYLLSTRNITALIKVHGSNNLLFFCSKYLILTDVNIPSKNATYRTTRKIDKYKLLSQVLLPNDRKDDFLLLGPKKDSDYIYCKCAKETKAKCKLCLHINIDLPNPKNFLKIDSDCYKRICSKPLKYVRVNEKELTSNSRVVLEGNPDLILISRMFFKKLTDSPPTYVRILSALPDAATLRHLICKKVMLYAFDVTQTHYAHAPLAYAHIDGHLTVNHADDELVRDVQQFLN